MLLFFLCFSIENFFLNSDQHKKIIFKKFSRLVIDPDLRITLKVAREHDFFEKLDNNLRLKAENGENINENGAT
ncbi:unnamed protein product [Meloidogyne enterolobii]|uniref:Uncharacterized protein n=1 Tax=Meloidogyne enterolobii TaxID=390850 RepID=A0ACB1AGY3_MELEN